MRSLLQWIEDRTGLGGLVRGWLDARVPGRACFCRSWPAAIAMALCVQVITGLLLWMYYSPSAQTAWESVYFLQYDVAGGWLLRAMHHGSAQVLLVLVGLYLVQMIVTGTYRAPRELVFWSAVGMKLAVLALLLTGDLLAWDQNSLSGTQTRVNFLELLPGIGSGLWRLAVGGPQFGHLTLTRFFALHVGVFSTILLVLLLLHVWLVRRANAAKIASAEKTTAFWPRQAAVNASAMAVVVGVILLLVLWHGVSGEDRGVPLGSPADTSSFFDAARPEWAFRGLYEFSQLGIFHGSRKIIPIFVVPGLLLAVGLAMPWIARCRGGHAFNVALTASLLIGVGWLSVGSLRRDRADLAHQAALEAEEDAARRVVEIARSQGIPPTGAITLLRNDVKTQWPIPSPADLAQRRDYLLRNDPKTQGPILFKTHCASCHDWADAGRSGILAEETLAPNLYGYATRQWVAGWLDPDSISSMNYFGETKFKRGQMFQNLEVIYEEWEDDLPTLRRDLAAVAAAVSAEAEVHSQRELDAADAATIDRGRTLIDEIDCVECHRFRDHGPLGIAPDLTGYGSREWTMGITADPTGRRFYGDENDGMPAYAEFPDDPSRNILTPREIELLTDWLRGEWEE